MNDLTRFIRSIPDYPKEGINFKDITPLLLDPAAFSDSLDQMQAKIAPDVEIIVGIESRGFLFGTALADRMQLGFVPARKPGKLPAETVREEYALEYGRDAVEMHRDAIRKGQKIVVVDDLLATGGTAAAAGSLVRKLGGDLTAYVFLIELAFLQGKKKLEGTPVHSLIEYGGE